MPTNCYVCGGPLNNQFKCSDCESVVCCEVCLVAHRKLMHPYLAVQKVISHVDYAWVLIVLAIGGLFLIFGLAFTLGVPR